MVRRCAAGIRTRSNAANASVAECARVKQVITQERRAKLRHRDEQAEEKDQVIIAGQDVFHAHEEEPSERGCALRSVGAPRQFLR